MSLYAVLVDGDPKHLLSAESALPKVVAHNLTFDAAERLEFQLSNDIVEGEPTGFSPYMWRYRERHTEGKPGDCLECEEIVLQHCIHLLHFQQQEKANRH